ncbi:MAG: ParB/RepB/Spo0J family partition protein [Lactococcus sp.]|uniref:Chromosome partitioning protein parB n=1 Tax=Pseudolactococcus piscium MKFS47 TaxID=297352 RepID=A0A0D6E0B7_9LACT|nr:MULTISPECIES: ParB/RepB/Spo0J family partition protein [Lactococcus]MDN5410028.1 ParB/RepB/Spo0J family partition protein [Lactococcus sp.]MDN5411862.1 ParB/RepB/Spo0J family partition protein [Lactococcus sp.]MDN5466203.1 ParB/RepB/Spo0J family partition protein [Lactococcus sp.]MDN6208114.1 ParB/RepB/Spo0J family partition protein [Lactococcus sp.]MDN6581889.1 ParB/RepB/Spo0J family partition protein [Lactococcus sp.]
METIELLPISSIIKNPYQPRIVFDEEKLQELSQSIKENGVLQPIIVRKSSIIGYEILAGERRFRASQLAGLTEIPAIIRYLTDDEMMTLAILENLQRDDLTVLDEARSLQNLVTKQGLTHAQVAEKLGKSRPYVSNAIRTLSLPESILQLIEDKKISQGHARLLLSLSQAEQQIAWASRIDREQLSVNALSQLLTSTPKLSSQKDKNIFIKEAEDKLSKHLGSPVTIQAKKIEIAYDNLAELNRLILILTHQ